MGSAGTVENAVDEKAEGGSCGGHGGVLCDGPGMKRNAFCVCVCATVCVCV